MTVTTSTRRRVEVVTVIEGHRLVRSTPGKPEVG